MNPKNLFRRVLLLAALSTAFFGAQADTLDNIRAAKKIRVSVDLAVPPSGMTDASMKPTGSDYDVAVLLAKDLGVALEVVPTVGATRIPNLQTGKADIIISTLAYRNFGKNATWNVLRGFLFDTHLDMPGRPRHPERDAAARALVRASNTIMIDVVDAALDLIESGEASTVEHLDLLELARLARTEDQRIRQQLYEMETSSENLYEALFR